MFSQGMTSETQSAKGMVKGLREDDIMNERQSIQTQHFVREEDVNEIGNGFFTPPHQRVSVLPPIKSISISKESPSEVGEKVLDINSNNDEQNIMIN